MTEPTTVEETPLTMEGLKDLLASERQASIDATTALVESRLDELSTPDRSTVESLGIGNTPHPMDDTSTTIVSRNQPNDSLYARIIKRTPELADWRSPDQDYWGREWLLGMAQNDSHKRVEAEDKLVKINARVGTNLIGDLDVSDPTAVLGGNAGHLLPQNVAALVNIAKDAVSVLPGLVMPLQLTSGTLRVPTAGAATAAMVAEGSTTSNLTPPFASEMLTPHKAQAFMKASVELIADSAFNVMSIYAQRAGTSIGALEDVQIATSNGTAPNITEALSGGNINEATTTVLIYEDLVTLFFALAQVYRTNAVWAANSVTLTLLSQLMDGNDHPILSLPGAVAPTTSGVGGAAEAGLIGSVFGKRVYEAPFVDGTLIFGDLGAGYGFGRRSAIVAESSTHADFASDLVQFKFTERIDGRIIDTVAIKQMADLATVA